MKKWWLLVTAVIMVGGLFFVTRGRTAKMSACKTLVAACKSAGFKRGGTPADRRIFRSNCLEPIFANGNLLGEVFDPEIISNCKAIFEKRRMRAKNT